MTCSPTCCPPGARAASPPSSNARSPTLGSRRALTATGPSRPSHPPKPSPSDEPDPRQTHNATALHLGRDLVRTPGGSSTPNLLVTDSDPASTAYWPVVSLQLSRVSRSASALLIGRIATRSRSVRGCRDAHQWPCCDRPSLGCCTGLTGRACWEWPCDQSGLSPPSSSPPRWPSPAAHPAAPTRLAHHPQALRRSSRPSQPL